MSSTDTSRTDSVIRPADARPVGPQQTVPTGRQLLTIAAATLAVRLLFAALACGLLGLTPEQYADRGDGFSYIRYARHISGQPTVFDEHDARVFPGFPMLIATLGVAGVPAWLAALAINFAAATAAGPLAAMLFRDVRVGWLMVALTPVYVAGSSMSGNEAPMLAFTLAGLTVGLTAGRWASLPAGLLLGLAGVQRPVACLAVLGLMFVLVRRRRWAGALVTGAVAAAVVALTMLAVRHWLGDALAGVKFYATSDRTYGGELFTWPFKSLLLTPFLERVQPLKIPYVWLHALAALVGTGLLAARVKLGRANDADVLALVWLALNTAYVLVIGSDWGFHALPRFLVPALPPLLLVVAGLLPRWPRRVMIPLWLLTGLVSIGVGLYHVRST